MKPTANYKMSRSVKTSLALMKGTNEQRNSWKRAMIDAELTAQYQPRREKSRRDGTPAVGSAD